MRIFLYACFFASGAAGLVYEVVWGRQLALFLGITSYAHAVVITAFMAGLAMGAVTFGRMIDRGGDALRLYAKLELGIGVYAALTPLLFSGLQVVYAGLAGSVGVSGTASHLVRFSLALAALLLPTFLMGGTLPVVLRGLAGVTPDLPRLTANLYGVNTLGATAGTFAAGFILLPALGVRGTLLVAVAMNLAIGVAIFLAAPRAPGLGSGGKRAAGDAPQPQLRPQPAAAPELSTRWGASLLLGGFALSGFAALLYQLAWIRSLTLVIGSSVHAFSTTLTVFLGGIALGSLISSRLVQRVGESPRRRAGLIAVLEIATAFSALAGLVLIAELPELFLRGFDSGLRDSFGTFQLFVFGLCSLPMLLPTLLLGALFPLFVAQWARDPATIGRGVGTAQATNTVGSILGALLGGLVVLPALGIHATVILGSTLHLLVGIAIWQGFATRSPTLVRVGAAVLVAAAFVLAVRALPQWDRALMTSGVFVRADELLERSQGTSLRAALDSERILYYGEGVEATVAVVDNGTQRLLVINGKTDASSQADLPTQILIGQLPMLMHPDPKDVLVIGLGSGVTLGSVATHERAERITILELSPEVVAASQYFAAENGNVLSDPRVDLQMADARNFLLAHSGRYDVIASEPSNPWISGVSNMFTQDFFELARSKLNPSGIMSQWFHTYSMSVEDLKIVLKTYRSVFPYVSVWTPLSGDLVLIGSLTPHSFDNDAAKKLLSAPAVRKDLQTAGLPRLERLFLTYLLDGKELDRYVGDVPLNTDDRPRIEFNAPRNLHAETAGSNVSDLLRHLSDVQLEVPMSGMARASATGLELPAFGISVRTARPLTPADWEARWMIAWQLLADAPPGGDPDVSVGEQRVMSWREGDLETRVQTVSIAQPLSADAKREYLNSLLPNRIERLGQVGLRSGGRAVWALARQKDAGQIGVALVWTCPDGPVGVTRHTAIRWYPEVQAPPPDELVSDLALRFACRDGG